MSPPSAEALSACTMGESRPESSLLAIWCSRPGAASAEPLGTDWKAVTSTRLALLLPSLLKTLKMRPTKCSSSIWYMAYQRG